MMRQSFSNLFLSGTPIFRILRGFEPSSSVRAKVGLVTNARGEKRALITEVRVRVSTGEMAMGKLQGKVAVITGGTEGIGLATAQLFVKEGAYVFITGRRQKELDEAVTAIGSNVTGVQGDVAKLADLDRLYETVGKVKGRIDIIFANAGVGEFVPFGKVSEEHFDRLFNINVKGALFTVQKGLPLLNDGGSIILTGSVASVKGTPAFGVYAASKAAIRSFVRTWTTDLKDRNIRSNVVSPGPIRTPLTIRQSADVIARIVSTVPMGRMGEPDEVAKAVLYLASDDSSFVTGIELFVDGGRAQV
jgi:NAD(P)-dependent dehydrogenase (short-subunit alcohol dehydrogenase family)